MSYVYALIDEDGDFLDYASEDVQTAEHLASQLEYDSSKIGEICKVGIKLILKKKLPYFVEVV
jgi:hypothetical protein